MVYQDTLTWGSIGTLPAYSPGTVRGTVRVTTVYRDTLTWGSIGTLPASTWDSPGTVRGTVRVTTVHRDRVL